MTVETQMRQILADMEVWLSYGATQNWQPIRGGGDARGLPPDSHAAHLYWRDRYERAFNKTMVVELATESLEAMRKQKRIRVVPETEAQLEARVIKDGVGWSVSDIANHCRCTEKFVRKARLKASVLVEDGKGVARIADTQADGQEHVRELGERGMTERQIAMLTGLPKTTVRRALGRVA